MHKLINSEWVLLLSVEIYFQYFFSPLRVPVLLVLPARKWAGHHIVERVAEKRGRGGQVWSTVAILIRYHHQVYGNTCQDLPRYDKFDQIEQRNKSNSNSCKIASVAIILIGKGRWLRNIVITQIREKNETVLSKAKIDVIFLPFQKSKWKGKKRKMTFANFAFDKSGLQGKKMTWLKVAFLSKKNDTVIFRVIFGVIFLVKTGLRVKFRKSARF